MAKHPMLLRRPKARVQSIATYSDSVVATAIAEPSSARAPPRRALLGGRLFRELHRNTANSAPRSSLG